MLLSCDKGLISGQSIEATSLSVKTALAEIEGTFNISESLVLETVSAYVIVSWSPFLHLTIGSVLST